MMDGSTLFFNRLLISNGTRESSNFATSKDNKHDINHQKFFILSYLLYRFVIVVRHFKIVYVRIVPIQDVLEYSCGATPGRLPPPQGGQVIVDSTLSDAYLTTSNRQ